MASGLLRKADKSEPTNVLPATGVSPSGGVLREFAIKCKKGCRKPVTPLRFRTQPGAKFVANRQSLELRPGSERVCSSRTASSSSGSSPSAFRMVGATCLFSTLSLTTFA